MVFTLEGSELIPLWEHAGHNIATWLDALPSLLKHSGQLGKQSSFCQHEGAASSQLGHFFEHICIELQNLAGAKVTCIRNLCADRLGPMDVIVPFEDEHVCVESGRWAEDFLATVGRADPVTSSESSTLSKGDADGARSVSCLDEFLVYAARRMLPVQDRALIRTAEACGIPTMILAGRMIVLGQGRFQQRLSATKTTLTNVVSNDLAANKDYARRVLVDLGLPVPAYRRVRTRRDATDAADAIGYPVVVKPNNGSMGEGVSVGVKNRRDLRDAYKRARASGRSVLIEEMVAGSDYRVLVINGRFCAASKRVPGHIVGDGEQTIEELVTEVNSDPRRGTGPTASWTVIKLDDQADRLIADLGYTRQSIPAKDEVVYLRRNANTSDGGTAVDVTDDVHPDNRDIAVRAAKAIGLDIAGVDFLTSDISTSMWENGGKICEINSRPGIRKHIWPAQGTPRDVLNPIIEMLFPANRPNRVPIVAVIGGNHASETAKMVAYVLTAQGHHVGLALQHSVYSGGRVTAPGPLTEVEAARRVLLDPDVDAAVLQLSVSQVLQHGLGCDAFDVVIIQNTHASQGVNGSGSPPEEETAEQVFDALARASRSMIIVEESNPNADRLERIADNATFCRVLTEDRNWRLAESSIRPRTYAACADGSICIYQGHELCAQVPLVEISASLSHDDMKQIKKCLLFASIAVYNLGGDPNEIFRSLSSFCSTLDMSSPRRVMNADICAQS